MKIIALLIATLSILSVTTLEAKHHCHSHQKSHVRMHFGAMSPVYAVQPAPIVVQQPVYVQAAYAQPATIVTYPQYYSTPTYVVQPQPVIIQQVRPVTSFNWGFANWGFSINL